MLELNPNNVLCGVLAIETEVVELYCDGNTGTIAYVDTVDGSCMCIGEMSISDPLELHNVQAYKKAVLANEYAGATGVVFTRSGVVYAIMDEYTAEVRNVGNMRSHSEEVVSIDINQEYNEHEI